MKVVQLQGHTRPITTVLFNKDGDLLFTAARDERPTLWDAYTGRRLGTYDGHKGAVNDLSVSHDSRRMLSASGDMTVNMWDVSTGQIILKFPLSGPVRAVSWAEGSRVFATYSDPFAVQPGKICLFRAPPDDFSPSDEYTVPYLTIELDTQSVGTATGVYWTSLNKELLVTHDSGRITKWDAETGEELQSVQVHERSPEAKGAAPAKINNLSFDKHKVLCLTASNDFTGKLVDVKTLDVLKTYTVDRPMNGAVISPIRDHIFIGGGQSAHEVTTTRGSAGRFETHIFNMIYEDEVGLIKGHFGPINAVDISPDGLRYASGSEDGFVRLHFFDEQYNELDDPVPPEY